MRTVSTLNPNKHADGFGIEDNTLASLAKETMNLGLPEAIDLG
jgi:hypothetical protein